MNLDPVLQFGLQGVLAYGAVGAIALILKSRWNKTIPGDVKLYLLVILAFVFGFIPVDFGNVLFNHLKIAVAVGIGINALNSGIKKVGSGEAI